MFTVLKLARIRGEAAWSLFFMFLGQACYSSASIYLSQVVAGETGREEMLHAILLVLLLYFLPYLLFWVATLFRGLWRNSARRAFYESVYRQVSGRPALATSREAEKSFTAIISGNGQELLSDCVEFVYGTARLLVGSILAVMLISIFVLKDFFVAYLISAVLCGLLLYRLGAWQTRMAAALEKSYNKLTAALPEGWMANTLGEAAVVDRFMRLFARRWRLNRRMAWKTMNAFQSFDLLQAFCIWLPAAVVIVLNLSSMTAANMIALAVVLPRLVDALLDISGLMAYLTDYLSLMGRVNWLNGALAEQSADLTQRYRIESLRLLREQDGGWRQVDLVSAEDAIDAARKAGRYVLSGPNGSGKTSLLLQMKMLSKDEAIYLPAQAFLFPSPGTGLSTGQRKLRELIDLFALARGRTRLILLDEWDANLDPANRERISAEIDVLARTHAVVEVSHRGATASITS